MSHSENPAPGNPVLFFERLPSRLRSYPYTFWGVVGISYATIWVKLCQVTSWFALWKLGLFLSLGVIAVPQGIRLGHQILVEWLLDLKHCLIQKQDVPQYELWCKSELSVSRGTFPMLILATLFALFAASIYYISGLSTRDAAWIVVTVSVLVAIAGFFAAFGLVNLACLARIVWRAGALRLRVSTDRFGVVSCGEMLLKAYFIGSVIWCFFTASITEKLSTAWLPIMLIGVPAFLFIVSSFVVCQLPLHQQMLKFKRSEILELSAAIDDLYQGESKSISLDNLRRIEHYTKRLDEANALPEWPFNWRTILGVVSSGFMAILPIPLGMLFPHSK